MTGARWILLLALGWGSFCWSSCGAPPKADEPLALPATDEGVPGAGPLRRYEWFEELWLAKRKEWADRREADQGALVFFGDSITQGWGTLGEDFAGTKVANRGISGDTTRGLLVRLEGDVLELDPRGVVLLIGTNDLEEGAEPQVIAGNLRLLLKAMEAHDPAMPVILCTVFPSSADKKRPASKIKEINRRYREVAEGFPQVTVVDTWTLFAGEDGDAGEDLFPDLLHPNDAGYARWKEALRPVLKERGLLRES